MGIDLMLYQFNTVNSPENIFLTVRGLSPNGLSLPPSKEKPSPAPSLTRRMERGGPRGVGGVVRSGGGSERCKGGGSERCKGGGSGKVWWREWSEVVIMYLKIVGINRGTTKRFNKGNMLQNSLAIKSMESYEEENILI